MAINVTARLEKKKKQLDGMLAKRRTMEEQIRQIQEEMKGAIVSNLSACYTRDALQMELERKNSAIDLTCVPVEKVAEWLLSYYGDRRSTRLEEAVLETSVHETIEKNPSDDVSQALTSEETFRSESAMQ